MKKLRFELRERGVSAMKHFLNIKPEKRNLKSLRSLSFLKSDFKILKHARRGLYDEHES